MLEIGRTVSLEVLRSVPMGVILGTREREDEVLLPTRVIPKGTVPGDFLEVFLYTDSEDRPIATTEKPLAQADEFASLRVDSVSRVGAFLDWGLPKDLLLPFRSQLRTVRVGELVVVRVLCDPVSGRPTATMKVERFLEDPPEGLREGQAVILRLYEETDLGYKAIVDGRFGGLLHARAGDRGPTIGATVPGYVQRIRPDGKVDLTRTPIGRAGLDAARETLVAALERAGGRIALGDQSSPEEIRRGVGLSKKAFKRAVGGLYRERRIRIDEASIEWLEPDSDD